MMVTNESEARHLFGPLFEIEEQTAERLHARLASMADREGLLDVAYRTVDTPVGTLLLAATERGLVRVAYPNQDHDAALAQLAELVSARVLHAPARLDAVARQLEEYFAHRRRVFDVPVDLRLSRGFRQAVLAHLPHIPYGATESYTQVAAAAGSPRAVRAVGTACATNPVPIVVPCHRVVRADGSYGGYAGGAAVKQALLTLEAA
ncbi:methylated-DNA--[protein]-cysteine S-methyltransferase [Actinopolymorpha alba]|uniref:methylated-DNA--[protein]-cysteine S-methyltransferase n=1 Tax=Actinopolymorpha alba TaxID=533267 RepID=UPI0003A41CEE|nr:methylated-DNA--[protein]-cysteine S-methyltransferase [Actinopolymorpha alba]